MQPLYYQQSRLYRNWGRILLLMSLGAVLLSCDNSASESEYNTGASQKSDRLNCPGVDGTYYIALIPKGECEEQGVTLFDEGTRIEDKGVMATSMPNCTGTVSYDGCSVEQVYECDLGLTINSTTIFEPGDPNILTGTQIQDADAENIITCEYEMFGSTDRAVVLQYAGLDETVDVSDLSASATPEPEDMDDVWEECDAFAEAESATCDNDDDPDWVVDHCVKDWQSYDAAGCGDSWRAYITCRTNYAEEKNCDTGEVSACDVYMNAYFQCRSDFAATTACSNVGNAEGICENGLGTYAYMCLGDAPPFADDCTAVETESAASTFCCF